MVNSDTKMVNANSAINNILRIDASLRGEQSISRQLADKVAERLSEKGPVRLTQRDVSKSIPQIDADWIGANFTPEMDRSGAQKVKLSLSDELIAELKTADTVLISTPIYNFGVPSQLKAWVDHIARAGITFRYTENGPIGLLTGKTAIVTVASGGTKLGSDVDFATPYIRQALRFVGIDDVRFIAADSLGDNAPAKVAAAEKMIETV